MTGANAHTGATAINAGTLQLSGASGALTGASSAITVSAATLLVDNTTAAGGNNNNRITDTDTLTLNSGTFIYKGADAASTNSSETFASIALASGFSTITITYGGTNTAVVTLTGSLTHAAGAGTALVNGVNLGKNSTDTASIARLILTTAPTLVGTTAALTSGINSASKNTQIVPFLVGEATATTGGLGTATGTPNTFLTYVAGSGIRPLNPTDEFTNNTITASNNILITSATTVSASPSVNSVVIEARTSPSTTPSL